ncbi:hypothetical protein HanIR_Chr17g0889831 [Helianthus annuus]|nr:hypothetical protein HanIR_Chr17g0889831 [Helianthus annuus]
MTRPDPTRLPGLLNTFFPNNSDVINCDSKVKTLPKQILGIFIISCYPATFRASDIANP